MTAKAQAALGDHMFELRRVFQASREAVFSAFTDPAQVKSWFGPRGYNATIDRYDATPGGDYRLCMVAPDGSPHWLHGRFLKVEPHERLTFTWVWEQGDMAGHETIVNIHLRAHGDATELVIEHSRLPSEGSREAHGKGWSSSFDCLDDLFNPTGRR
jgi:uncharacterized protein YndB with AHSA1/START domain